MFYSLSTEFNQSGLYPPSGQASADRLWGFHVFFICFLKLINLTCVTSGIKLITQLYLLSYQTHVYLKFILCIIVRQKLHDKPIIGIGISG